MSGTMLGMLAAIGAFPAMIAGAGIFFVAWAGCVWLICAILVATAAHSRGRSVYGWLALAIVLTPLPAAVMLLTFVDRSEHRRRADAVREKNGWRLCPSCSEVVRSEACRCRFCLSALTRGEKTGDAWLSDPSRSLVDDEGPKRDRPRAA